MRHRDQQECWTDAERELTNIKGELVEDRSKPSASSTQARSSKSEFTRAAEKSTASRGRCASLLDFYRRQLTLRPRVTNGVVSGTLSFTADVIAQNVEHHGQARPLPFDIRRTCALALTSSLYSCFVLTNWILMIAWIIPGTSLKPSMVKLAITQTILQPFGYVPFFLIVHGLFTMESPAEILAAFQNDYFTFLMRLWSVFMPTRLMMFLLIPLKYQVLWDTSVSFLWNIGLSISHMGGVHQNPFAGSLVGELLDKESFGYLEARQPDVAFLPVEHHVESLNISMT